MEKSVAWKDRLVLIVMIALKLISGILVIEEGSKLHGPLNRSEAGEYSRHSAGAVVCGAGVLLREC